MDTDSMFWVTNNTELLVIFNAINASLSGLLRIANNTNNRHIVPYGILYIERSEVEFHSNVEVVGNGEVGGITASYSNLFFYNKVTFSDNHSSNGGAVTLLSSVMHISFNATIYFTRNYARWLGGAIYITFPDEKLLCDGGPVSCSIQMLEDPSHTQCLWFSITFNQNKAGIAGNAIYGGYTSACMPTQSKNICYNKCPFPQASHLFKYIGVNDSSDLSSFTSEPTRVCFCDNGIPDCYKVLDTTTVYPGEYFNLSVVIVGYGIGTVPGSVTARANSVSGNLSEQSFFGSELELSQEIRGTDCHELQYSVLSEKGNEQMALAVEIYSFFMSLEKAQLVSFNHQYGDSTDLVTIFYDFRYAEFFYIPLFVNVSLLPCPIGFQLVRGKCVCHQILVENNIDTCFFSNGTGIILRPAPYWIGFPSKKYSSIIVQPHCPFDYCKSEDIDITAESPNTQCQYQRSGVLCGSCSEGLSMILGSSECKKCSNIYIGFIGIFILAGIVLIAIITLLNMTVSVGTVNGLILFANILQANQTTFFPVATYAPVAFLSAFIAWLNLDVGIPMCFFDGLTTYFKTWLQFVFPFYILTLVGVMIVASNYSTQVTRLLGTNAVSVLATLVLLSYTKILRIIITAFSFTTLTGSQDYHSVVWLADGNIKYFELKHTILFLFALLLLLLLGIPYTIILTAAPWIQKSKFKWVSSLYNMFKPLFDTYMGPYKDNYRYWTGMLLLVRVILIVVVSSIANTVADPQLNLLLLTLSSTALLAFTALCKPYKQGLQNGLEIFHHTILFIFASSNLYVSRSATGIRAHSYIYIVLVGACFLVFLGICAGHIWYRVESIRARRRPNAPERKEGEWYPRWQRATISPQDEVNVTISTAATTNTTSGGEESSQYRDSCLELAEIS